MARPRVMPPVYLLAAILTMIALHFLLPVRSSITGWWRWLGVLPIAAGLGTVAWVATLFGRHQTTIKPGDVSTRLLVDGPFRVSRNPIYLGMVGVLSGTAVALGSLTPWLVVPVFILLIARNIIPIEEGMLAETFGEQYAQYRAKVRRWI